MPGETIPSDAQAERTHRALLAKLRHDLRTPINAILGYCELLLEDARDIEDAALTADLEKIRAAGEELLTHVNETLANDRIASGELDIDIVKLADELHFKLRTPCDAIIGYCEMLIEDAESQRRSQMVSDLEKIRSSAMRFTELINDIVRFTIAGDAILGLEEKTTVELMVEDAVKSLEPSPEDDLLAFQPASILVVDDSPISRDILVQRLSRRGHKVQAVTNGKEALEVVRTARFDLILLDILMPELNGYQVLQALKQDAAWRDIPVIMISALEDMDSIVRCIKMGAEDYLPKPFNPVLLKARIDSSLEKKRLRDRQRELFGKFATKEVAEELLTSGFSLGGKYVQATAMFSDIRSFTTIAEAQSPAETIALLNSYFSYVMEAIGSEGGIVNQMVGDGIMAIFGAPLPRADHHERAVRAALKMMQRIAEFNAAQQAASKRTIQIGIGIASGEVIAGYTGSEMRATYTCVGDTVNLAARLESHTKVVGQPILIDQNTRRALSPAIQVEEQGEVQLKGKSQAVRIYSVPTNQSVPPR